VIAALALAVPAAPASATVTFGADLSLTPDLSFHCPLPPPFFGPYRLPDTCTAFTSGVFGGAAVRASQLVPDGQGEITKLRLREPNVVSSPLKMTVLRALRTPQSSVAACCTVTSESPAFTPTPGTITEVTFNPPIPVHAITTATGVYEFEAVALTATDANSVIPAATAAGHSSGAYYPAAQPGQERYEQQTSLGTSTQIEFEVDWEPVATGNGTGGSAPPPPAPPTVPAALRAGRFTGNTATIPLVCELTTACQGTLRLQDARPTAAAVHKPKLYGSAKFSARAGKTVNVKVKLNAAGRKLVRRRKSVTLYATTTIGAQVVSAKVKLSKRH